MNSQSKRHMLVGLSLNVQSVWIGELRWIPVGCAQHEQNTLTLFNAAAVTFERLVSHPCLVLDGAVVAEKLLNRDLGQGSERYSGESSTRSKATSGSALSMTRLFLGIAPAEQLSFFKTL